MYQYNGNRQQRNSEKQFILLDWICQWNLSTRPIIENILVLNSSLSRWFRGLEKKEIVRVVPQQIVREKVFMLTPLGKTLASSVSEYAASYNTDVSKVNSSLILHNLKTQKVMLDIKSKNKDKVLKIIGARNIPILGIEGEKRPDGLIEFENGLQYAIEVELSYKTKERVYRGYNGLVKAIKHTDNPIQGVVWIFENESMKQKYKEWFDSERWPTYYKDKIHRWIFKKNVSIDEPIKNRFLFLNFNDNFEFKQPKDSTEEDLAYKKLMDQTCPIIGQFYRNKNNDYIYKVINIDIEIVKLINKKGTLVPAKLLKWPYSNFEIVPPQDW